MRTKSPWVFAAALLVAGTVVGVAATNKPPLHAKKWLAITGKPLAGRLEISCSSVYGFCFSSFQIPCAVELHSPSV